MPETVLVVGSTGNIGLAAVKAALDTGRNVLAVVRTQASAEKLFKFIGSDKGIITVEADVLSDTAIKGVVDQVRAGKLPAFQHVWSSGRLLESFCSLQYIHADNVSIDSWRRIRCRSNSRHHYRAFAEEHELDVRSKLL